MSATGIVSQLLQLAVALALAPMPRLGQSMSRLAAR